MPFDRAGRCDRGSGEQRSPFEGRNRSPPYVSHAPAPCTRTGWSRVASRFTQVIHRTAKPRACAAAHLPLVDDAVTRGLNGSDVRRLRRLGQRRLRVPVDKRVYGVGTARDVAVERARTTCGLIPANRVRGRLTCTDAALGVWIARSFGSAATTPAGPGRSCRRRDCKDWRKAAVRCPRGTAAHRSDLLTSTSFRHHGRGAPQRAPAANRLCLP